MIITSLSLIIISTSGILGYVLYKQTQRNQERRRVQKEFQSKHGLANKIVDMISKDGIITKWLKANKGETLKIFRELMTDMLNTFDSSNPTLNITHESQLPALPSTPNTAVAASIMDRILETTSWICSRTLFDLTNNTIVQDVSILNNAANIPSSIANISEYRHKTIRDEATTDYLKSVAKCQKLYNDSVQQLRYEIGDIVGLEIDRVDRTNTSPKPLPCKVISIHTLQNDCVMYKLCTLKGVLSVLYGVQDLLDLRNNDFADLRSVDPTIPFTQACKEYVSVGINSVSGTCNCSGKCATKACPCKAKNVKCCTKCHPKNNMPVEISNNFCICLQVVSSVFYVNYTLLKVPYNILINNRIVSKETQQEQKSLAEKKKSWTRKWNKIEPFVKHFPLGFMLGFIRNLIVLAIERHVDV
ncbi:unnamed protein product [Rotaria socialis]